MIINIKPITYVAAGSIDRQRALVETVDNHERDKFFRELIRPIIIRTIANNDREAKRFMPGADQMIGASFGGRVG